MLIYRRKHELKMKMLSKVEVAKGFPLASLYNQTFQTMSKFIRAKIIAEENIWRRSYTPKFPVARTIIWYIP